MSYLVTGAYASSFADSPSVNGLETIVNALLAPLLSDQITGVGFTAEDPSRNIGVNLRVLISYDTSGSVITHPYLIKGFFGQSIDDVITAVNAYIAANPTYFISPAFLQQLTSERRTNQVVALVVYNTSLADGLANWAGGGGTGPIGAAGGDLSGTYPNPSVFAGQLSTSPGAVATTLDSVAAATYKRMLWDVEAVKGVNTYGCVVSADHDGTTAVFTRSNIVLAPGTGTFDFVIDVDISGANFRLRVTPATGGWTFRVRQLSRLAA